MSGDVEWTEEDEARRQALTARIARLGKGTLTVGQRAEVERRVTAARHGQARFYPENSAALNDRAVERFLLTAKEEASIGDGDNYLIVPRVGGYYLIQQIDEQRFWLLGERVVRRETEGRHSRERFRVWGPAGLDSLVRHEYRRYLACDSCAPWSDELRECAALLPLPNPPHVVVMGLCLTCTERLASDYSGLHFIFPTTEGATFHG